MQTSPRSSPEPLQSVAPQLTFIIRHVHVGVAVHAAGNVMHVPVRGAMPAVNSSQKVPAPQSGPALPLMPITHRRAEPSPSASIAASAAPCELLLD